MFKSLDPIDNGILLFAASSCISDQTENTIDLPGFSINFERSKKISNVH
jgi:hypothetical protein